MGNSLWNGFASMLGEEYALNTRFVFDGKEYVAKVALETGVERSTAWRRAGSRWCTAWRTTRGGASR